MEAEKGISVHMIYGEGACRGGSEGNRTQHGKSKAAETVFGLCLLGAGTITCTQILVPL